MGYVHRTDVFSHANSFRPDSGLQPLYGGKGRRADEILADTATDAGEEVYNPVVLDLRDVGKTVLLKEFIKICTDGKFLPVMDFGLAGTRIRVRP